jgi:hypothetical protein
MRAWCVHLILLSGAIGCGSSSTASPSVTAGNNDAAATVEAGGDMDAAHVRSDARIMFNEGGAAALAPLGAPCQRSRDCFSNSCNQPQDGFPGGYCTADCGPGQKACPTASSCVALNADTPACYVGCMTDADCRMAEGYRCLDVGTALLLTGPQKVCFPMTAPQCNFDADCPPSLPHCMGGWVAPDAGGAGDSGNAGDSGAAAAGDDGGGPPMPGIGTCGP